MSETTYTVTGTSHVERTITARSPRQEGGEIRDFTQEAERLLSMLRVCDPSEDVRIVCEVLSDLWTTVNDNPPAPLEDAVLPDNSDEETLLGWTESSPEDVVLPAREAEMPVLPQTCVLIHPAELARLEEDWKRLDFLESLIYVSEGGWREIDFGIKPAETLREAIDAARSAAEGEVR